MGGLLKMVQNLEFMQQDPLAELQIPMQMIFPTVLAIGRMDEKLKDQAQKYRDTWEDTKAKPGRSEKSMYSSPQYGPIPETGSGTSPSSFCSAT